MKAHVWIEVDGYEYRGHAIRLEPGDSRTLAFASEPGRPKVYVVIEVEGDEK